MELNQAEADLRAVGGDPALADALSRELATLFQSAQVKQPAAGVQVLFNKDKALPPHKQRPNNRGIRVSLWCCGQKVKRCNQMTDARACPSWADAARCLRCEVEKDHSSAVCLERARAARAAAPVPECAPTAPRDFFAAMRAGSAEIVAEQRAGVAVQQLREQMRQQEAHAGQKRLALEAQLAANLAVLSQPQKKQQLECSGCSCSGAASSTSVEPLGPYWAEWDLTTWRRLEASRYKLRRLPLEDRQHVARGVHRAARGHAGALHHDRRGLVGSIQEWAGGSRQEAAVLITKLVKHFDLKVRLLDD